MSTELAYQLNYQEWKAYAQKLEQTVKALQAELVKKDADIAGLLAMIEALKADNPNSTLLNPTGETFKNPAFKSRAKTNLTKVYEAAHDAEARKRGISDPTTIRAY